MKKLLLYLSLLAALTLVACTSENSTPEDSSEKEVVQKTSKSELVYNLDGEEVIESDIDIVKINNTNIKMILPSSYTYEDGNSVYGNGEIASYSVSVTGKEQYEGTRFYFENELEQHGEQQMEMKIRQKVTMTGLEAEHELQKIDSTKFDQLYKMTAPGTVIYFAAKTVEGKTHYISAYVFDPEKLSYEDYLLNVLDTIEFNSEN